MAELLVIRHAQASFGSDDYDRLSPLGHVQSALAGDALRTMGWVPDRFVTGTLVRQTQTLEAMGFAAPAEQHAGLNEYDFADLLHTRFEGRVPDMVRGDRKTHFRTLRETILEWQAGGLAGAGESWAEFSDRVADALRFAIETDARRVLAISSGGPIGQLVARTMNAPPAMMMDLNLQVKNTSMTKFVFSKGRVFLHQFNATPHLDGVPDKLTYS